MDELSLNDYFTQLLEQLQQDLWSTPVIIKFIDYGCEVSKLHNIQMKRLTKMVSILLEWVPTHTHSDSDILLNR